MRLLHIDTLEVREFISQVPAYAIASHRWFTDELTFQDRLQLDACVNRLGYKKIQQFCHAVKRLYRETYGLNSPVDWLWIDTICIDKTNSVELQEALNSMFKWYKNAEFCVAWLSDVISVANPRTKVQDSLWSSAWFTRGWTLQELVAPRLVIFFNCNWEPLGYKVSKGKEPDFSPKAVGGVFRINETLSEITEIPKNVLWDSSNADKLSIEEKQLWMRGRTTTRVEDMVYCQLGILGVFMPLIYGEGDYAMVRLRDALEQKARHERQSRR